ncbi:GNAT family N-acetyltransferase [Aquabacter spiritensis]|uniref:Putative acetyltransferase n=1 Tax=Aquabacter spiritensis TaxID=933073 RepID=A0A4R3LZ31_9HYPH|nr:GNAT family N-acetyltransferase [Aquabacter spiritensis]TCT05129.1 putative acetyltransferase [Aquabacter spiritensis]
MPAAPGMAIVAFRPDHLAAVADLWVATWSRTMPDIDFEARRAWFLGHLDTLRGGGAELHVAAAPDGTVAGFVAIDPKTGYLDQIAVAPAFWGSSAALALMATAKARAPSGITLDVNQDNPRAIAFYRRLGFRIVSEGTNPASGRAIWRMAWTP